ncbi:hypothetical protein, partial [Klebsiella pneumoniae]|uniref:hypothetical protein n=1 Tax=Klebsiella pneumoniae TaxID=573 RepID=UPI0015DFFB16
KKDGNDDKNKEHRFGFFNYNFQEKKSATFFLNNKLVLNECYIQEGKNIVKAQLICGEEAKDIALDNRYFLSNVNSYRR